MSDQQTPDPLEHVNPLLQRIVESVTTEMARAFGEIWSRPDAAVLAEGFLDGRTLFLVERSGVTILERPPDQQQR
jgi:hypothetical protein